MDTFCMVFVSRRDDNSGRLPGRERVGGGVGVGVAAGWERAADELAVAADKERQMNWRLQPIESLRGRRVDWLDGAKAFARAGLRTAYACVDC